MARRTGWRTDAGLGVSNVGKPLLQLLDEVHKQKDLSIRALALTLVRQIKIMLSFPGTGRIYKRPIIRRDGSIARTKRGKARFRTHRASAPGHPPAVDYGKLRNSIDLERLGHSRYRVGTGVEYAQPLEDGTKRVAKRPFMKPSLKAVQHWWKETIVTELRRASDAVTRRGGRA